MSRYVGIDTHFANYFAAKQMKTQWCWAASIRMVLKYYGIEYTQDKIVERTYGKSSWGTLPNWPASFDLITRNLNNWNVDNNGTVYIVKSAFGLGKIPVKKLIYELSNKRPIILALSTGESTGHAVVVTGASYTRLLTRYRIDSIIIRDPWPSLENKEKYGRFEDTGKNIADIMVAYWLIRVNKLNI